MYVMAELVEFRYKGEIFTYSQLFSLSPGRIERKRTQQYPVINEAFLKIWGDDKVKKRIYKWNCKFELKGG